MSNKLVTFEAINAKELSESNITQIAEVEKDMWAHGIGEYVKCNCCEKINSKSDIFGDLSLDIREESVIKLEEIFLKDSINCTRCNSGNTEFIYDVESNIDSIKDRYFNSKDSYVSFIHADSKIHGFCDGYVDSFKNIYERELKPHYEEIGIDTIRDSINRLEEINDLENVFILSSIGTEEKYKKINYIFDLLKSFSSVISQKHLEKLGIVELSTGSVMHSIFDLLGSKQIILEKESVVGIHEDFNSDIYVLDSMVDKGKKVFRGSIRDILKLK